MKKLLVPLLSIVVLNGAAAYAQTYLYSTIAGVAGQAGSTDGTNSVARLQKPSSIAFDNAGNLYIADTYNHTIRQATPTPSGWAVTTIAGHHGSSGSVDDLNGNARFNFPYGIAVDNQGVIYVADTYNHTIRKVTPQGSDWNVTTLAGSAGSPGTNDGSSANFNLPEGIAVDSQGTVYVADTYNHTIRMIAGGWVTTLAGVGGTSGIANGTNDQARFYFPQAVAVDPGGNLYVADTYNCTVRRVSPMDSDWVVTTLAGQTRAAGTADGTNNNAQFDYPSGLALDSATNIYVADTSSDTVRKITSSGTNWVVNTIGGRALLPGSANGLGTAAQFNLPRGLALDANANIYLADTSNHTIRFGLLGFAIQSTRQANKLILSWPAAAASFTLETRAAAAVGAWTPLTTGIFLIGDNFVRTNTIGSTPAFFRLHQL